ncbi:hypothetical protein JGS22_011385 [Streptomyces sp. P38-E01]|uniref:DUF4333 domain-containing protein n=1 Tax=Streptomyces tardus TaxID=2780544 RepID=A0A949JN71_9ACTN|nr:hypothetical protein [Streptomyces tardus]MBU7598201.1 hypothetical protein [Streptomyces tardus]
MRITRTLVGAVAVAVLAVGCGGSGSGDGTEPGGNTASGSGGVDEGDDSQTDGGESEELPVKIDAPVEELLEDRPKINPEPPRDASETERVVHDLREKTLAMAGVEGRTAGSCAGGDVTMKAGATTTCTVTYEGLKVPWEVTISDRYEPGSFVFTYQAKPQMGLLTAKGVGGEFFKQQNRRGVDRVQCSEIPDAELVELNIQTEHRCQYPLDEDGEERWSVRAVEVQPSGLSFGLPRD